MVELHRRVKYNHTSSVFVVEQKTGFQENAELEKRTPIGSSVAPPPMIRRRKPLDFFRLSPYPVTICTPPFLLLVGLFHHFCT